MSSIVKATKQQKLIITARPLLALFAGLALFGCAGDERPDADVLATIGGEPVTRSEVEEQVGDELARLDHEYRQERHQMVRETLEGIVRDRLLEAEATSRGVTADELTAELQADVEVTESEVSEWYERNRRALGGRSLEELTPRIEEFLLNYERRQALIEFAEKLEKEKRVIYLLEPFRAELEVGDSPANGPADAPVTLVEFSDFECPYCGSFVHTLRELEESYADKLRVVYRQYPLEAIHPHAFKAAEASLCAHEQGRFWEMHDLLFEEQDRLDVEGLKEKAGRLRLKQAEFDACLDSGRMAERVRKDMREGNRLGIEGTPAIFINGIPVPGGAVPYAVLAEVVEKELRRRGAS